MEIYLVGARLFLVMETNDRFTLEAKGEADRNNPKVQEWENLMWKYQVALPQADRGEKWALTERVYKLEK